MAVRNAGVVEIPGRVGGHAQPFHDGGGPAIALHGEGYDFLEANPFEAIGEPGFGCLGDIAMAPEFGRQPPADLDGAGGRNGK